MSKGTNIDGVLLTWGDRLFYPGNRIVRSGSPPKLGPRATHDRVAAIRKRIEAAVRRAPQVMVKVTGGGRGMRAIAAHFRYISKNGRLDIEDDRGETLRGCESVRDLADDWRYGGSLIPESLDDAGPKQAFNIMLSMPRGTSPMAVLRAAREFARIELSGHKYVMVLHDHQANPHVHLSVRAESRTGRRLNPRKSDLHRWRETFAEQLREQGIDAEATRQATRGISRNYEPLWCRRARVDGRLRISRPASKSGLRAQTTRVEAIEAWQRIGGALGASLNPADQDLARSIDKMLREALGDRSEGRQLNVAGSARMPSQIDISP